MKYQISFLLLSLLFSCSHPITQKTVVIAHRGASGYLPEHTLESYSLAYGMGADFIEPDLVLTKDNVPIILHDIQLDSTTNVKDIFPKRSRKDGHYYAIDFTLKEIKKLNVHERKDHNNNKQIFPNRFPSNVNIFSVPTFSEFLSFMKGLNHSKQKEIGIYPEIKRPDFHRKNRKDITKIVYSLLKEYGYEENTHQIFIQSFDPICLKRLKFEFKTKIPLIQLADSKSINNIATENKKLVRSLEEIKKYAEGIGTNYTNLVRKTSSGKWQATNLAFQAKNQGLLLHPYTLRIDQISEDFSSFEELVSTLVHIAKVDGFFSDFTDRTKNIVSKL